MKGVKRVNRGRGVRILKAAVMAGGLAVALPLVSNAALLPNVVFNDNLAGSSTYDNATNSPTSTTTNYDVASSKNATTSAFPSGGPLQVRMASTSSGIAETQALFTSSPVALANNGDSVELTITYTDQQNILGGSTASALDIGLYNSGGAAPLNSLTNGGLTTGSSTAATGGVQNWVGYYGQIFNTGAPKLFNRPRQNLPPSSSQTNVDQDLIASGATGGFADAPGTNFALSDTPLTTAAVTGHQYTDEFLITLTAPSTYTVTENLYAGTTDTGTSLATASGTVSTAGATSFDGLAFGWRASISGSGPSGMDINNVEVTTSVPEPATLSLLCLTGAGLLQRKRPRV